MKSFPYLMFKENNSLEFSLYIVSKGSYKGASRDVTYTSVPGRNGDLITDNGRYNNVTIPYKMTLLNKSEFDFATLADKIKDWLSSESGYFQLWDSYDKNYFRLASYEGEVDIEQELEQLGSLSLSFNCKPFKYSFEGQKVNTISSHTSLYNAELYPSKPYFKIYGSGTVTLNVNNESYVFNDVDEYIEVDSEMMNAYKDTQPLNHKMVGAKFPEFVPGMNLISWSGNVEKIDVIPRWCRR